MSLEVIQIVTSTTGLVVSLALVFAALHRLWHMPVAMTAIIRISAIRAMRFEITMFLVQGLIFGASMYGLGVGEIVPDLPDSARKFYVVTIISRIFVSVLVTGLEVMDWLDVRKIMKLI